jgi:uncharacterized membrane protein YidH (DUF202 family)
MTSGPEQPASPEPAQDMEDLDPGLARFRTDLAWTRTAISFAALGAAIAKEVPVAGGVVLAGSALIWGTGRVASSSRRRGQARGLLLVTVAVTGVAIVALVLALVVRSAVPLR